MTDTIDYKAVVEDLKQKLSSTSLELLLEAIDKHTIRDGIFFARMPKCEYSDWFLAEIRDGKIYRVLWTFDKEHYQREFVLAVETGKPFVIGEELLPPNRV